VKDSEIKDQDEDDDESQYSDDDYVQDLA